MKGRGNRYERDGFFGQRKRNNGHISGSGFGPYTRL